jgi:threonine/homoserine/homoserine lactone efflux protein
VIGVSVAAPVGPIGVLTIRRTLTHGRLAGFATGLGVASADAVYASIAAFSLTLIATFLISVAGPIRITGGIVLLYLGFKALTAAPADQAARAGGGSLPGMFASAFGLTLANPPTILTFLTLFSSTGALTAVPDLGAAGPTVIVLGVFAGSVLWWLGLSLAVSLLRSRFTPGVLRWVNRFSGLLIIGLALWALSGAAGG